MKPDPTPAELCCYRLIRLMAAPKKKIDRATLRYRDADGNKLESHFPALAEAGYIKFNGDYVEILR